MEVLLNNKEYYKFEIIGQEFLKNIIKLCKARKQTYIIIGSFIYIEKVEGEQND